MNRYTIALMMALCVLLGTDALAQVQPAPSLMNFQGRLTRPDGTPVANGTYSVRFSLWTALTGGTEKWNQTQNVTARNGVFAVALSTFPAGAFDGSLYLEIKIGTSAPLTPRQPLVSVAYAMKANSVPDASIGTTQLASGAVTSAKLASGVLNPLAWLLSGNSGTNPASQFLGTTDNKPLIFKANNQRVMRYEDFVDTANNIRSVNVIGGLFSNSVSSGVYGAVIAGGGQDFLDNQPDQPNTVSGNYAVIGGGALNKVTNFFGQIGGGFNNRANGDFAVIAGGRNQENNGGDSFIGGGKDNFIETVIRGAFIGAGVGNINQGDNAFIGAGEGNNTQGKDNFIGGGTGNYTFGDYASVLGGYQNQATSAYAAVVGGGGNIASGISSFIGGGGGNQATDTAGVVMGGTGNVAGYYGTVAGGVYNKATGFASFASGVHAEALTEGSVVFADNSSSTPVQSYLTNQFRIRAQGGVLIDASNANGQILAPVFLRTGNGYGFMHYNGFQILGTYLNGSGGWIGTYSADPLLFFTNNGGASMALHTNGNVGIGYGASSVGYRLAVNGSIYAQTGYNSSDARWKQNIATFPDALDTILNLRGVTFDWKKQDYPDMNFADGKQIGFIAQEVEKVLPELVSADEKGYKAVAYANVVPVLVEAIKTLNGKVEAQQKEIADLKTIKHENTELRARNVSLEKQFAELAEAVRKLQAGQK